jgi:hypothetical protein
VRRYAFAEASAYEVRKVRKVRNGYIKPINPYTSM